MVEKYVEIKMFIEYTLPLIIFGIIVAIMIVLWIVGKISDALSKRSKKRKEEYFDKE